MIARRNAIAALVAGLVVAGPASAQVQQQVQQQTVQQQPVADSAQPRRRMLEQMVRQRWLAVVRDRLQLTDAQMARLQETTRHFSAQRNQLNQAERGVRREMRDQLTGAATADDKRLAVLIDSLLDLQRQRLDVLREEQHELSLFMTPLQRVRYLALQEQLRQRIEALRQHAGGRLGAGAARPDEGF